VSRAAGIPVHHGGEDVKELEVTPSREREANLRAAMDEDLSNTAATLKAHKALLQALHDTQQEHTATLAEHTATLAEHTATLADDTVRLDRLERKVDTVEQKVGTVQIGVHAILDLLDTHLAKKSRWTSLAGLLKRIHRQGEPVDGT
jgi:septal ring factor EnvC (AmiA/AmiB activator)